MKFIYRITYKRKEIWQKKCVEPQVGWKEKVGLVEKDYRRNREWREGRLKNRRV